MGNFRNVIEEPVIGEAKACIELLSNKAKLKVSLSEVVAYSLNRLPPMYATSKLGWQIQYQAAYDNLGERISQTVHHAIDTIQSGDPFYDKTPLPHPELEDSAKSLTKLEKLFSDDDLVWAKCLVNTRKTITTIADLIPVEPNITTHIPYINEINCRTISPRCYQNDATTTDYSSQNLGFASLSNSDQIARELGEFESYVLRTHLGCRNVLENLILSLVEKQLDLLGDEATQQLLIKEVVAYTLNRLPPMYATYAQGLECHKKRIHHELAKDIPCTIYSALMEIFGQKSRKLLRVPIDITNLENCRALATI